ncbi:hypothetical protein [Rhodococcoides kroppenstedtii]|uniref:hypothetical protein n=1 Tax=Rhodococcoides kroppenstedtii TaxID=293050 RepID=UPI0036429028
MGERNIEWYDRPAAKRALLLLAAAAWAAISLPAAVDRALTERTPWTVGMATLGVVLAIVLVVSLWRRAEPVPTLPPAVDPARVPTADVDRAISSTASRVEAVSALRARHRGLGIAEASLLVNDRHPGAVDY